MMYEAMPDDTDDGRPSEPPGRWLVAAAIVVWFLIIFVAASLGLIAFIAALTGGALVFAAAAVAEHRLMTYRFPVIETVIVLVLGFGGVVLVLVWLRYSTVTSDCGFACPASSVSNAPGP